MKKVTITFLTAVLLLTTLAVAATTTKSAAVLLREGLYAEEVEGNLDAAIATYQQVIADPTAPKNLVAQALYRQGMCLMKKKNEAEARVAFQKLVTDYGDQTELVEKVKPILEELSNADPASLMPPETLVYVEIGSPGRQVETILNMLKGTPLENPLSVITGKKDPGQTGEHNAPNAGNAQSVHVEGPAQIISALLNPSMMAEFKKIRGMGVGFTEIAQNNPPAIIVLFPGRSDALRGVATMALSLVGQAGNPIEGMQFVSFSDGGGAAYDDNVIILASPSPKAAEQLQWAVKQYKGRTNLPSLASANKSFAKISKQARQQNALTIWLNVSETYQRFLKMMPADQVPQQFKMVDGLVDLKSIDDLYAFLSLRETGVAIETNLNFKPGYQSMAWSIIHTPNLNKAYFQAVPPQAVALVSFGLGGAGTPQAVAASQQIRNAIGVDIGPQIFGNIEQVTLFAAPPRETVLPEGSPLPPAALALGLAIASKNPPETQKLLLTLLQATNLAVASDQAAALPATGQFEIALTNNQKVFGYTDEPSKLMVLSLNPQVIGASLTAVRQNASVLNSGPLQDAVATLSATTSKLVLINVGGALQLAAQSAQFGTDEDAKKARQCVEELIKASQKTTLRLQTNESADSFGIRVSLSDLPPLSQIFGPAAQLVQMVTQAKARMRAEEQTPPASIMQAGQAPVIDGKVDEVWNTVAAQTIDHVIYAPPASQADLSADFRALYDGQALYILVNVTDDQLVSDSTEPWLDDGVEVFIDADNSKSNTYGDNDYQFHFDWDSSAPALGENHHNKTTGVEYAFARTDNGYRLEAKLPWSTLGVTPAPGKHIGLDVQVNDDDDGGDRDSKIMWHAQRDTAWQQPNVFGTGELAGLLGWWKLDEKEGTQAADSSGNGHNATVRGNPQWQPTGGKLGGALAFDGNGDYLEVADESAFDAQAGLTISAWIKVNAFDKRWQAIIAKGDSAWRLQRFRESSPLEFACSGVHVPSGDDWGGLDGKKEISPGEWHHVVGVYDGKQMRLYVDGVLDVAQEAWGAIRTNDQPVWIGENSEQRDRYWNGLIDEVRVYNYGLAEAQVQQLYQEKK